MTERFRLAPDGDAAATIEHVAEQMWESRRVDRMDPVWADAGSFWREKFVEMAAVAVAAMR